MRFRVSLTDPDGNTVVLSEPEGLKGIIVGLTRHPELSSLVKEFKTSLRLYGSNGTQDGRRDWLKNVEAVHGPDAVVTELIEIAQDDYIFEEFSRSEVGIQTFVEDNGYALDHGLEYTAVQLGFWRKAMNRFDVPVNIQSAVNLDGETVDVITPTTLRLPSQIIDRLTTYKGHTGDFNTVADCVAATTANITLSGLQTIDGVPGYIGMRTLVKNQTDQKENGVYIQDSGSWTRASDSNTDDEIEGMIVFVTEGTTNAEKAFKQQTDPVTIGSSNIVFNEYDYVSEYEIYSISEFEGTYTIYFVATASLDIGEIQGSFDVFVNPETNSDNVPPQIELTTNDVGAIEMSWDIDFNFIADITPGFGLGAVTSMESSIKLYYQINEETPVLIDSFIAAGSGPTIPMQSNFSGSLIFPDGADDRVFQQGDYIKLFFEFTQEFEGEPPGEIGNIKADVHYYGGVTNQNVRFAFKSTYSETNIQSFLIHDVIYSVMDRITDSGRFYSELLGSPQTLARVYAESGCYWENMLAKGVHVRGYTLAQKQFSISMKEIWEGLHPHLNLSIGYETIDGIGNVIRLEERSYQYDSSQMSVLLSGVQRIKRKYNNDQYFNSVESGNSKGLIEDVSGIDDPYRQTRASIFKNIGKKLTILSSFITQPLTWEWTRRSIITKSSDNKYDNDTFMVEVIQGGSGYTPKLDEDYDSVTGLLNEETRYNKRWTPARMFVRWSNYIFNGVQNYIGSVYRFVSGEGNYDMTSERKPDDCSDNYGGAVLAENGDIPVTTNHLYIPIEYEIEHYLTTDEFNTIDANRKYSIGVSQFDDNHQAFFITDLQYEMMSGQIKLTGYFKDPFDIVTVPPGGQIFQGGKIFDSSFEFSFE